MKNTAIQRGIVAVRAEADADMLQAVGELNTAFADFRTKYDAKVSSLAAEVDELNVKHASAEMNGPREAAHSEPSIFAAAGFSAQEVKTAYAAKTRDNGAQATTLAEIVRGIAGMKTTDAAMAALSGGTDSAGGYSLPSTVMPRILDALSESSAILRAGARILPMEQGAKSTTIAAIDTLPVPAWRQELGTITESAPTFRGVVLQPKSLACIVRISRELLADSPDMDRAVRTAVGAAVAAELDRVSLVGSGTDPEPGGIFGATGVNALSQVGTKFAWTDVLAAWQKIAEAKGPQPTSMIVSPRTAVALAGATDLNGQWLGAPPMLSGLTTIGTVGVPNNLGVGLDESLAFVGNFSSVVIAMRENMSVQRLTEAYAKTGEIALLVHSRIDIGLQYPQALATIDKVK